MRTRVTALTAVVMTLAALAPATSAGQPATLIAENIPNAASMCYDSGARQLVIPMNANNAIAFFPIQ